MLLAYAFLTTLFLGVMIGSCITVIAALRIEEKQRENARRRNIHPSSRPIRTDYTKPDILKYDKN